QPLSGREMRFRRMRAKRASAHQLHGEIRLRAVARLEGAGFIDSSDSRMLEAGEQIRLVLEAAEQLAGHEQRSNELERHRAPRVLLLGFINDAHAPFAEDAQQAKITDLLSRTRHMAIELNRQRRAVQQAVFGYLK